MKQSASVIVDYFQLSDIEGVVMFAIFVTGGIEVLRRRTHRYTAKDSYFD
jgi:hypothetical protein